MTKRIVSYHMHSLSFETPSMQNDRRMRQGILPLPFALFRREKEQTEKLDEEEECLASCMAVFIFRD